MKNPNFYRLISILLLLTISFVVAGGAQVTKPKAPTFDTADFSEKAETAKWLVEYDEVAWKTTDVLVDQDKSEMKNLGQEWFCFQDAKMAWHAIYGKLENNKYTLVVHYLIGPQWKITRTQDKVDQEFLDGHARALVTAKKALIAKIPANSPTFNPYIRRQD